MSEEKIEPKAEKRSEGGGEYSPPTQEAGVTHSPQYEVKPPEEKASARTESDEVDYSDYTVSELKDMAHKRGVEVHSDMLKDDIIAALQAADKAG